MGTGKTLMCLALIISTLHQPCLPPQDNLDISAVMTDRELKYHPFENLSRFQTNPVWRGVPSLVELCSNVIAIHDPAAKDDPAITPPARKLLAKRNRLYFDLAEKDECYRAKKKVFKQDAMTYLPNTTLVVVPDILIPQWRAEIEKHLVKGALKMLIISRELPSLKEMIGYDVS